MGTVFCGHCVGFLQSAQLQSAGYPSSQHHGIQPPVVQLPAENVTKFLPAGQAVFGSIGARRHDPVTGPQACYAVSDVLQQYFASVPKKQAASPLPLVFGV